MSVSVSPQWEIMELDEHLMMMIATLVYGVALLYSIFLWRKGFQKDDKINASLVIAGFCFHSSALFMRAAAIQKCPINNLFEVTMFTSWIIGAGYVIACIWAHTRSLGIFISPVIFSLSLMSLFPNVDSPPAPMELEGWFILHVPLILLSYGAFALAAVSSLMYLTHVHYLKYDKESVFWVRLPSIGRLENASSILVYSGFGLLTVGLAFGFVFLKMTTGTIISQDAKTYWSIAVWVAYGILALTHRFSGIRGRYLAWAIIGLFIFVLTTFWGANLLSDIHNSDPQTEQVN